MPYKLWYKEGGELHAKRFSHIILSLIMSQRYRWYQSQEMALNLYPPWGRVQGKKMKSNTFLNP